MTQEIREPMAVELDKNIHEFKQRVNNYFIEIGKKLKKMRDEKLYTELGYETFESYIAQPSLGFHRRSVYAFIGIIEDYVESEIFNPLNIAEIDWSKLDRVRQFKETKEFPEWVEKARTLSLSDLNQEVKEAKANGNKIVPLSAVVNNDSYEKRKCKYCGEVKYLDFRTIEFKKFKVSMKREIECCDVCAEELMDVILDEIDSFEESDNE